MARTMAEGMDAAQTDALRPIRRNMPMLRRATIFAAAFMVVLFAGSLSKPANADVSFSFFYSNLSPYGTWAVSADYGRVWRPYDYEPGWNPYYDGHWVYTDYGWTWVSDYAWGAVPYHYGTWALDPYLGWVWVPGYVWAPSWVVFTSGPDYIGWAPVPAHFVVGASIGPGVFAPQRCVFVPARAFLAPRIRTYAVPRATARVALSKTRIVNNISVRDNVVVNHGPDPRGIERAAGRSVRPVPISRVKNVTPAGRFDVAEVRADRHERGAAPGGAPRVTTPEPPRPPRPREEARPTKPPATAPPPAEPSGPPPTARPATSHPPQKQQKPQQAKPQKPPQGNHGGGKPGRG
jgi:hypothetical protein